MTQIQDALRILGDISGCSSCGGDGEEDHTCPLKEEIHDRHDTCNCCDACRRECAMDI